ncbi:MAG TPA: O-antigen ligase family protein [Blastocatellia bacterium]|jgi:O-antigen ligase|nr:O-antigen ligase family protein [Blastocatellia bacterium]
MTARLDKAIRVGFVCELVFTCLSHGGVEPWSLAIFELMTVALMLIWAVKVILDQVLAIRIHTAAMPLALFLGIALVQCLAFTDGAGRRHGVSMDTEATRSAAQVLFFLLVSFIIAGNFFDGRKQLRALVHFLIYFGLALALFALAQHFTWNGSFYWLRRASAHVTSPFGPFVNRNHFAGYMEMLIPLPLAIVIARAGNKDLRMFHLFAAAMMAIAAVASLSRGGMISLIAELIFLTLMSIRRSHYAQMISGARPYRKLAFVIHRSAFVLLVLFAVLTGVYWTGPERVIDRVARTNVISEDPQPETFFTSRGWIWQDTLEMFRANPILGVGLGAYETAYPIYSRDDGAATLGASYAVDKAHNDYFQVLADTGVIGGALTLWFIISLFQAIFRASKSSDPLFQAIALGCGAGIFGLLTHSLFDFNLQLPSNALLFLLLAAAVSHAGAVAKAADAKGPALLAEPESEFAFVIGA